MNSLEEKTHPYWVYNLKKKNTFILSQLHLDKHPKRVHQNRLENSLEIIYLITHIQEKWTYMNPTAIWLLPFYFIEFYAFKIKIMSFWSNVKPIRELFFTSSKYNSNVLPISHSSICYPFCSLSLYAKWFFHKL